MIQYKQSNAPHNLAIKVVVDSKWTKFLEKPMTHSQNPAPSLQFSLDSSSNRKNTKKKGIDKDENLYKDRKYKN